MVANAIRCQPFDAADFPRLLAAATGGNETPHEQLDYLARYCAWLGARTVVIEDHYVDRHFLDEHAFYYARKLDAPRNAVARVHVFAEHFDDVALTLRFAERARFKRNRAEEYERALSKEYLGFISIRPLPTAPLGRTVLRSLRTGDRARHISAVQRYPVHLGNLRLSVEGIPFQQQDVAVGACATVATWTALSQVTKLEGMRAPTPAQVAEAASRHLLTHGRTLPAVSGLNMEQLSEAIRNVGFAPEYIRADVKPEYFVLALHTYLQSGIPVVLSLVDADANGGEERHAVTAVGFQMHHEADPRLLTTLPVQSAFMRKLYVHDDGLGPYARAFLRAMPTTRKVNGSASDDAEAPADATASTPALPDILLLDVERRRSIGQDDDAWTPSGDLDQWVVGCALAPVYPKLRLSARCMMKLGESLAEALESIVGTRAPELTVDFRYKRSGSYVGGVGSRRKDELGSFLRAVALPRWCGIVRWYLAGHPLVDFIYDTTDIVRPADVPGRDLLRAIVSHDRSYRAAFANFAKGFSVPVL